MKKKSCFLVVLGFFLLYFCGYFLKEISEEDVPYNNDLQPSEIGEHGKIANAWNINLTGEIVQCNKCMGYGKEQEGLYAQPEICRFCWISTQMRIEQGWSGFNGRYGQVDAVFNTLPADFFDELDWNADIGFDEAGGTSSSEHIEAEIAMHEKNIAQIEHQLEYINGAINRTILEQRLIEEQYAIKRLRNMLNYK